MGHVSHPRCIYKELTMQYQRADEIDQDLCNLPVLCCLPTHSESRAITCNPHPLQVRLINPHPYFHHLQYRTKTKIRETYPTRSNARFAYLPNAKRLLAPTML